MSHTADRMKLSSETFIQGFVKTCGWTIDTKHFLYFITSRSKVVILMAQQGTFFVGHNIAQSRTIYPPNPTQF